MKILIVDNGTSYLSQLKNIVSEHEYQIVKYPDIGAVDQEDFDAIILSGGHGFPVNGNSQQLQEEMGLVKNSTKPIFGICFGFEIIAHAFGAELEPMQNKKRGVIDIKIVEPDGIFLNLSNIKVFENHRWTVKKSNKALIVLARSEDGIEAIKHKTRPIYAVQFHPEMSVEKNCGDEIFHNFLNSIK